MNNEIQTVFIIDDDEDVRDSLAELLESVGMKISSFCNAIEFLENFNAEDSGCILVDVRMPGMSGIELQDKLNSLKIKMPLIIMTGHGDVPMAVRAMKNGAFEFVQKPFRDQELIDIITKALNKDMLIRAKVKENETMQKRVNSLTAREKQVVDKVLEGKANKVIARELDVSDRTIEIHRSHAMHKLGVKSVAEMVKLMLNAAKE